MPRTKEAAAKWGGCRRRFSLETGNSREQLRGGDEQEQKSGGIDKIASQFVVVSRTCGSLEEDKS